MEQKMYEGRENQNQGFSNAGLEGQQETKDYLWFSILNLVFCCLPLGIAAIIYSRKTRDAFLTHDMTSAAKYSRRTLILNISALVLGIILNIAVICLYAVLKKK